MANLTVDLNAIDASSALTLAVAWKSGRKTKLRQISIGGEVESAFREVIASTLQDLGRREPERWTPDADLTPETYLVLPASDLGPAPMLATEHLNQTLAESIAGAENLPAIHPNNLPAQDLSFYTLTVGDVPGQRSTFLRKANPRRGLKRGRMYTFLSDSLQRLDAPIFAFDRHIDLVFVRDLVCVLSQSVFTTMFRDQDMLAAQVPTWVGDLTQHISITDDGVERLTSRALKDSRLRARLEAIVKRAHLSHVSATTLRAAMNKAGLDADRLINSSGHLTFEDADIPEVLHFLNEDLFVGALTNTGFRADKKAAR